MALNGCNFSIKDWSSLLHKQSYVRLTISLCGAIQKVILDISSDMCALEVGGGPWYRTWKTKAQVQEPLKSLLKFPIDVEGIFNPIPQLKPPGL